MRWLIVLLLVAGCQEKKLGKILYIQAAESEINAFSAFMNSENLMISCQSPQTDDIELDPTKHGGNFMDCRDFVHACLLMNDDISRMDEVMYDVERLCYEWAYKTINIGPMICFNMTEEIVLTKED